MLYAVNMSRDRLDGPTDKELLIAWQGGDKRAGQQLFHRYYDQIERFFINKVSSNVEDLVQETFLGCLKGHQKVKDQGKFRPYLYRIAYNKLNSYLRLRYQRDVRVEHVSVEDIAPGPVTILTEQEEERLLLMALRRIPVQSQVMLELHYWEGNKMVEIAEIVGIPEGTVKSRMKRAREQLGEAIAALSESPELLESTTSNLPDWVENCRRLLERVKRG